MLERGKNERGVIEMVDTESLVPPGHLLRQVDAAVDFEKLYEIVEPLYSEEEGRRSIDPVVLFKIVLLQHKFAAMNLKKLATWKAGKRFAPSSTATSYILSLINFAACLVMKPDRPLFDRLKRSLNCLRERFSYRSAINAECQYYRSHFQKKAL